jgi:hypothetical protein
MKRASSVVASACDSCLLREAHWTWSCDVGVLSWEDIVTTIEGRSVSEGSHTGAFRMNGRLT